MWLRMRLLMVFWAWALMEGRFLVQGSGTSNATLRFIWMRAMHPDALMHNFLAVALSLRLHMYRSI